MSQHKYVALLRGINVGSAKRVSMEDLRNLVHEIGFEDAKTLLNSGNLVFSGKKKATKEIAFQLEKALEETAKVSSKIRVLTADEFGEIVSENSLLDVAENHSKLLVPIYFDDDCREKIEPMLAKEWAPESLAVGYRAAYIWCANGILESKLVHEMGKLVGDRTTSRNWATVMKIQKLLEGSSDED